MIQIVINESGVVNTSAFRPWAVSLGVCVIDLALWLNPLDGENPSGEDLRNDPRFHELERLTRSRRSRSSTTTATSLPRKSPFPSTGPRSSTKAEELRAAWPGPAPAGHRDARARQRSRGLAGLAQGLTLIAQTFDAHWETMHPALRRTRRRARRRLRRINALLDLQNGQDGLLANLRADDVLCPARHRPDHRPRSRTRRALDERTMLQEAAQD